MDIKMLNRELGNADLVLIDQILKDRYHRHMRILDAGCGEGRNMVYFVKNGYNIYGIDQNEEAVELARTLCRSVNREYTIDNIQNYDIKNNPFPDGFFDAIICINVLHDSKDIADFLEHVNQLLRVLKSGGSLLLSMESRIGLSRNDSSDAADYVDPDFKPTLCFSRDLGDKLLTRNPLREIEPVKSIVIDDLKSYSYLFLRKES